MKTHAASINQFAGRASQYLQCVHQHIVRLSGGFSLVRRLKYLDHVEKVVTIVCLTAIWLSRTRTGWYVDDTRLSRSPGTGSDHVDDHVQMGGTAAWLTFDNLPNDRFFSNR